MDAKRVLQYLRYSEWSVSANADVEHFCPSCHNSKEEKHAEGCSLAALITEAEQEAREGGWKPTGVAAKLREKAAEWYAKNSGVGYHVGRAYECAAGMVEAEEDGGWKPGAEPPNIARVVAIRFHVTDSYGGVALVEAKGLHSLDGWRRVDLFGNCYPVQVIEWRELSPLPEAA